MDNLKMLLRRQEPESNALDGFQYYHYEPSMPAAMIFVIAFFLTTGLHSYQMFRTRTWFMIPFWLGGLCKHKHPASPQKPSLFQKTNIPPSQLK